MCLLFYVVSLLTKNMSSKKVYMEMEGYFQLETHIKCAGSVTFILLRVGIIVISFEKN